MLIHTKCSCASHSHSIHAAVQGRAAAPYTGLRDSACDASCWALAIIIEVLTCRVTRLPQTAGTGPLEKDSPEVIDFTPVLSALAADVAGRANSRGDLCRASHNTA